MIVCMHVCVNIYIYVIESESINIIECACVIRDGNVYRGNINVTIVEKELLGIFSVFRLIQ